MVVEEPGEGEAAQCRPVRPAFGSWHKVRDPQAADRFYKALVLRCGETDLGREAAERRWFPKLRQ